MACFLKWGKRWWGFGMQWHKLDHIQTICTLLQTDNHTNTASLNFYRPYALPDTQPTVSKHWRQLKAAVIWQECSNTSERIRPHDIHITSIANKAHVTELTHTHTFNSPFSGTTQVSWYQKGKTNLDFTEARDSKWQWNPLGHMQVCTSLQTDNHASTQPTASKHWRQYRLVQTSCCTSYTSFYSCFVCPFVITLFSFFCSFYIMP